MSTERIESHPSEQSIPSRVVLLDYPGAAELLGLALPTLYSKVCRKEIPHIRLSGRMVRFDRDELIAWLNEHRVPVHSDN